MPHRLYNATCVDEAAASIGIYVKGVAEVGLHKLEHLQCVQDWSQLITRRKLK